MRRAHLAVVLTLAAAADCGDPYPPREFDCAAIVDAYVTGCGGHLGISVDTAACEAVHAGQNGPLAPSIDRAAGVCEEAALALGDPASCGPIFVCLDDEHGLSALTRAARVTGTANVEGQPFTFDIADAWAWVGTTTGGNPGDLEVLFHRGGQPWYFRLDDFAERARTEPFAVDTGRPIKLENSEDNLELAAGTVTVEAFALAGAFTITASGVDPATGEGLDLRIVGSFAASD